MATTIINFKADKELRDEAKQVARDIGLPLGTVMNQYLREFVRERRVVFSDILIPNKATQKKWDKILDDVSKNKNIKRFESAKDLKKWLDE